LSKAFLKPSFQYCIYRFNQIIWEGVDLLFPPVCAGCGKAQHRFCDSCVEAVVKSDPKKCILCGERLQLGSEAHSCPRQKYFDRALVWGLHTGPLRNSLHQFKYRRDLGLADAFAQHLAVMCRGAQVEAELIVPVPLAKKRYRVRGYNQAALLAAALSGRLAIRCLPAAVERIKETRSQVGLAIDQRRENVADAFRADSDLVSGKSILLVDDVLTTGATLNSCSHALKQAGAVHVIAVTLARAP
jgi:ComF family protein